MLYVIIRLRDISKLQHHKKKKVIALDVCNATVDMSSECLLITSEAGYGI